MDATSRAGYARKRGRTRRRLLRAGMVVMARRGLDVATVGDIAAEAGVVTGTFYNHFPTRDDLLDALTGVVVSSLQRAVAPILGATADPADRVARAVAALVDGAGADEVYGRFVLELATRSRPVRDTIRDAAADCLGDRDPVAVDAVVGIALEALRSRLEGRTTPADTAALTRRVRRAVAGGHRPDVARPPDR